MSRVHDVAVVGGGLLGAAIAWGLARLGQKVIVLDEGDVARRASRANFALVWVQGKGLGLPPYARWSVEASRQWPTLAEALREQTGLDVHYQRPGGFHICLSEAELDARRQLIEQMYAQGAPNDYGLEMVDRSELEKALPEIGPDVVGASYSPHDGHVNSLRTFRAFHAGLRDFGADYRASHDVDRIEPQPGGGFVLHTSGGRIEAAKVVLAAGNGNERLAPQVGLFAPMMPTRGQIIVTERVKPFLHYPLGTLRQTDEGTVMIGDSKEEILDDRETRVPVTTVMADRARRTFPLLNRLNVVRTWSGIRVMTRDGFPIYDQSASAPGAFVACCHSGVTLASMHALELAPRIRDGGLGGPPSSFSARRFADAPETLLNADAAV
ncbi:NAD(P)/FAD-dependent oxidoreductase [Paracoccus chinensis]|uniref:FAD dependent oxidoreductase domain-containing protein n=1 Tax=Paracoccus chinensis TaxID=525640 RepID=A0A1G9LE45_9RHOB|nr:FAD-dependent oxidoreductase [Paracoccus chinensis]SDL60232.1 hypothetical protein SAMN04487971_11462 [Paracoccus chinensis]